MGFFFILKIKAFIKGTYKIVYALFVTEKLHDLKGRFNHTTV